MIRVRGVSTDRAPLVASIIEVLRRRGVPNLFGPQRFGYFGNNHLVGRALLKGRWEEVWSSLLTSTRSEDRQLEAARQALSDGGVEAALRELGGAYNEEQKLLQVLRRNRGNPRRGARALPREAAWRYLTAYQSLLFNRCTARRMPEIDALRSGDIALKHSNKAAFLVERPDEETARLAGFAISPAGPMFGSKLLAASGAVAEMEHRVLAEEELSLDDFAAVLCGVRLTGERRPYRVPVAQWQHEWEPSEQAGESILRLSFFLPAGSFATAVLRELMRTPDLEPPS
jgi:tRNA pseudouridine13 synthase